MLQLKVQGKCYLDFAFKFSKNEYMFSVDLGRWSWFKKGEEPGTGYTYTQFLCFRVAKLKRDVFDQWVDELLGQVMPEAELPKKSKHREDVM